MTTVDLAWALGTSSCLNEGAMLIMNGLADAACSGNPLS